ncbi:MAG: glycerol-3-phosphate 1-O-acyltransferase [Deltaproteobacteria bacterium]|nr:glycerol-3-phosphate 1-O-acyltransferase [Deltaproteobacteria bacterium]
MSTTGVASPEPARPRTTAQVDGDVWPGRPGEHVVFLLDASSRLEERILRDWIAEHRPSNGSSAPVDVLSLPPSRRRPRKPSRDASLETLLAGGEDMLLAPLRVAWERGTADGVRENPLKELLTVGDPRDPGRLRQSWILRRHPQRCHVVVAAPARTSELRERWREQGGADFTQTSGLPEFVERQAMLALERAERRLRGQRYKVPKLVREDILARATFRAGVAKLARSLDLPEKSVAERAGRYLREIAATHSPYVIDLSAHLIHLLYTQGYSEALHYDRQRLEEIYGLGQRHPLVFLPSHKSNLDHLVLQYALHENGHPPNHTAGGINMNFFPVGPLVRRSGVFFIRRTFKDNEVYKFVLRQYVDYLIEKRFSLEWYIEGGRSRSGKLLPPRLGLLAYVADAYKRGKAEDVFLIPVSIAYDQIQDVGDYVAEQRGAKKQKESFGWMVHMIRSLRRRYGQIYISFGEPVSLRAALGEHDDASEIDPDEQDLAIQKLAFEVAVRIDRVTPITSTSLVTLALLGVGDRALSLAETRATLDTLLEYVTRRQLPVTDEFELGSDEGLQRALDALVDSGVLSCFSEGPDCVYRIADEKHLTAAYYRNTIIHFFLAGAIAELALLRAAEPEVGDAAAEFEAEALRLRDLLKFEFFFAEKEAFRDELVADLDVRASGWRDALALGADEIHGVARRMRPLLAHRVLRPFLEGYQVVADGLEIAPADKKLDEAAFLSTCTGLGKQYVLQRRIRSPESVSRVVFQTALQLARNRGLVDPGGEDLAARRSTFAEEVQGAVRRIDAIDSIAAGRRAGLIP